MPAAPEQPQLLITARVAVAQLCPQRSAPLARCRRLPRGARGSGGGTAVVAPRHRHGTVPAAPRGSAGATGHLQHHLYSANRVCVCVNVAGGGPTGTGWAHSTRDTPHPCHQGEARVSGGGHPCNACQAPAIPEGGGSRVTPRHQALAAPHSPLFHYPNPTPTVPPPTQPGGGGESGGRGGFQASTPAAFGAVLAAQGLLLVLLQVGQSRGAGGAPQPLQLLAVCLQHQLRQPREGLRERSVWGGEPGGPPTLAPPPPPPSPVSCPPRTSLMLRLLQALVS